MKRIALLLAICICLYSLTCSAYAKNNDVTEIEYFADGSYIITVLETNASTCFDRSTISKTKTTYYYDSSNNLDWKASLTASFSYNGTTSSCTSASIGYNIYDNNWRLTSSDCSKSGATATGNFTFKHYTLGIPTNTINRTLTLTCDPNGNIT